ncbi:MAG: hypothetical protein HY904_20670 [Deltaproteobacteria bacterium]|nr:hypothetical protein [Deltaproteobacteria bacterium]
MTRGVVTITGTVVSVAHNEDPSRSFLLFSHSAPAGSNPGCFHVSGQLTATQVVFERLTTCGAAPIAWAIVTGAAGQVAVRHLTASQPANGADPLFVSLSPQVDATGSFVLASFTTEGNLWTGNDFMGVQLTPSRVEIHHSPEALTTQIRLQVVTMAGARVQRGITTLPVGIQAAAVPVAADPARSWLLAGVHAVMGTTDTPVGIPVLGTLLPVDGSHLSVALRRLPEPSPGHSVAVPWELVELPAPITVVHGELVADVGATAVAIPVAAYNSARDVVVASYLLKGGLAETSSVVDAPMEGGWFALQGGSGGVQAVRLNAAARASLSWFQLRF